MKTVNRSLLGAMAAATVVVVSSPAAHANSFQDRPKFGGFYSYNDGGDQFCVQAKSGTGIVLDVTLRPDSQPSRGPAFTFPVSPGAKVCRSLATAYEDTYYRMRVVVRGSIPAIETIDHFYS